MGDWLSAIRPRTRAGIPGSGGFATAVDLVTFYQMLLHLGALNGARFLGPRTVQYVTCNHTDERVDERFGIPMHRGLGVHVRGDESPDSWAGQHCFARYLWPWRGGHVILLGGPGDGGVVHLSVQLAVARALAQPALG